VRSIVRVAAAALVLMLGVSPVLADHCLLTCQSASRSASTSDHSCHHAASAPGASHHVADDARPCDHEHGLTASISDDSVLSKARLLTVVGIVDPASLHMVELSGRAPLIVQPSVHQVSSSRTLPLRI